MGRKLPKDGGRAIVAFFTEVKDFITLHHTNADMKPYLEPIGIGLNHLQQATMWFMQNAMTKPDNAGAGAYDYLHLFGHVALGFMWAQMAQTALTLKEQQPEAMETKLVTARYFMERILPDTATRLARITTGATTMMALPADQF